MAAVAAAFAFCATAGEIVVENAAFRLTLGADGCAQSLVAKSTGEECLITGVRIPFARIRQDRPYDNEMHLIHPAKPMFFAANRISRVGDMLEIGFADEYHVLKVRLALSGSQAPAITIACRQAKELHQTEARVHRLLQVRQRLRRQVALPVIRNV